jgi:hypothetical protein
MRGPQLFPHSKHPNGVAAKIKPLWQIYTNTYDFSVFVGLKSAICSPVHREVITLVAELDGGKTAAPGCASSGELLPHPLRPI